jgi:hypothetical protein
MIDEDRIITRAAERLAPPEPSFERLLRRRERKQRRQRVTAGVVGVAVFVAVAWVAALGGRSTPAPTPRSDGSSGVPSSSTSPRTRELTTMVGTIPLTVTIPNKGWAEGPITEGPGGGLRVGDLLVSKSIEGPQGAEAVVYWTAYPEDVRTSPCANASTNGPSPAELADAMATAPGTYLATAPEYDQVGLYPATHLSLIVRDDRGCDPGYFFSWDADCLGPCWVQTRAGDRVEIWIVEYHGDNLVIVAETTWQATAGLEREVQQIVDSIRLGPG